MGSFGQWSFGRTGVAHRRLAAGLALSVAGLSALAGCAQGHQTSTENTREAFVTHAHAASTVASSRAAVKPLPALTVVPQSYLSSLAGGRLVFVDGCFYLAPLFGSHRWDVVWPVGYTARAKPLGVYDAQGRLVARPGQGDILFGTPEVLAAVPSGTVANTQCLAGATDAVFIG
jgi:hypothetical protein